MIFVIKIHTMMDNNAYSWQLHRVANNMASCTVSYDHLSWSCFCNAPE